jgi:dienelactone hydrolase
MEIEIQIQNVDLKGMLEISGEENSLVIFTHGSGSDRYSKRNGLVADELQKLGVGTLLLDLFTKEEDEVAKNRFKVELLTERLIAVTKWCMENERTKKLRIGYYGVGTGSAAALSAAAYWGTKIKAVVSRGGRPDLAMDVLDLIESPTLLIVGGEDRQVIGFNRKAYQKLGCVKKMEMVAGAMEKVVDISTMWFVKYL